MSEKPEELEAQPVDEVEVKPVVVYIKAFYVGDGPFIHGIPARDLTREVWAELTKEQKKVIEGCDLYEVKKTAVKKEIEQA